MLQVWSTSPTYLRDDTGKKHRKHHENTKTSEELIETFKSFGYSLQVMNISAALSKGQATNLFVFFLFVYRFRNGTVLPRCRFAHCQPPLLLLRKESREFPKFVAACIFVHCLQDDLKFILSSQSLKSTGMGHSARAWYSPLGSWWGPGSRIQSPGVGTQWPPPPAQPSPARSDPDRPLGSPSRARPCWSDTLSTRDNQTSPRVDERVPASGAARSRRVPHIDLKKALSLKNKKMF